MTAGKSTVTASFKRLLLSLAGLLAASILVAGSPRPQAARDECAGINKEVNAKALEAVIQKYRRGEPVADGLFSCRKAFPVVVKHALDPDPKVRERMTFFLGQHYSPAALQALVRQIEKYPADQSAFPAAYAARYPCYFFRRVRAPSLSRALEARIRSREGEFKRDEIHLLGCLAPRDARARTLLEEMSRPSFLPRLGAEERDDFSRLVTYALAEAGAKEAEGKVLAELDEQSRAPDAGGTLRVLEELKQFTNCRVLRRYAQFITDKRPGREVQKISDPNDPAYKTGNGLVRLRVGDDAIRRFASVYGAQVAGISEDDLSGTRAFTDEEMDSVYRRVKRALGGGRFGTCRPPK